MSAKNAIKAALERVEQLLTLKPERGQRVYRSIATSGEGTACVVEEGGHRLTLDVGKALGGADLGPSPSVMLRAAMSGCIAIGITQAAARRDVPIDGVTVVLETDVDARGQLGLADGIRPGFEAVRLVIDVISPADKDVVEQMVETSLRVSPLMDVFETPHPVVREVVVAAAGAPGRPTADNNAA
ncbi:MAG: OsmC family protein [Pseudomonadota bacterium]